MNFLQMLVLLAAAAVKVPAAAVKVPAAVVEVLLPAANIAGIAAVGTEVTSWEVASWMCWAMAAVAAATSVQSVLVAPLSVASHNRIR